jgi:uncharacterized membrane protein (UPF0127 family)
MAITIAQNKSKLIKKLPFICGLLITLLVASCLDDNNKRATFNPNSYPQGKIKLTNGQELRTFVAKDVEKQTQGLSGVLKEDFEETEAMLFYYEEDGPRRFWMPDTYFNLDIFFLDKNLQVIDIERNMPAHPGRSEPPRISQTRTVKCRHVLELKSNSELSRAIKIGDQLTWTSEEGSLSEIK